MVAVAMEFASGTRGRRGIELIGMAHTSATAWERGGKRRGARLRKQEAELGRAHRGTEVGRGKGSGPHGKRKGWGGAVGRLGLPAGKRWRGRGRGRAKSFYFSFSISFSKPISIMFKYYFQYTFQFK